jgi:hypothetical protein
MIPTLSEVLSDIGSRYENGIHRGLFRELLRDIATEVKNNDDTFANNIGDDYNEENIDTFLHELYARVNIDNRASVAANVVTLYRESRYPITFGNMKWTAE